MSFSNEKFIPLKNSPGPLPSEKKSRLDPLITPDGPQSDDLRFPTPQSSARSVGGVPPGNPKRWVHVPEMVR